VPVWAAQVESVPGVPERFLRGPTGVFFLGLLLIVLTFFLPGGIVYGVRRIRARLVQVIPARADGETADDTALAIGDATAGMMSRHGGAAALDEPDTEDETDPDAVSASAQATNQGEPT
jgi:hypothetical protein